MNNEIYILLDLVQFEEFQGIRGGGPRQGGGEVQLCFLLFEWINGTKENNSVLTFYKLIIYGRNFMFYFV